MLERARTASPPRGEFERDARFFGKGQRIRQAFQGLSIRNLTVAALQRADRLDANQRSVCEHLLRESGSYAQLLEQGSEL